MKKEIILASHGHLSEGMLDTVQMIIGNLPCPCRAYCLEIGHSPDEFVSELKSRIESDPETEYDIAVDLVGASVCTSFYSLTKFPNVHLFTGMNLNLVLSLIVEHPENLSPDAVSQILSDAKEGIQNPAAADHTESDEF